MIGNTLLRYADNQLYMGSDLETNGLNLRFALPWELSFAVFSNKRTLKQETHYIRWPDLNMSAGAARVTGFDWHKYDSLAQDPVKVLDIYEQYLYDPQYRIVMQNGILFDVYAHRNWREKVGRAPDFSYLSRYIDTIALTKAIQKGWIPDRNNFLPWLYKAMSYRERKLKSSLEFTGKYLGIQHDYSTLHKAGSDVDLMIKIFQQQIWRVEV